MSSPPASLTLGEIMSESDFNKILKYSEQEATKLISILDELPSIEVIPEGGYDIGTLCSKLDHDWALSTLIETWAISVWNNNETLNAANVANWRASIKATIGVVQSNTVEGEAQSIERLKELIALVHVELVLPLIEDGADISQHGSNIPTTQDIKYLNCVGWRYSLSGITRLLDEPSESTVNKVFPKSKAPHLNRLPLTEEGCEILKQLAARAAVFLYGGTVTGPDMHRLFSISGRSFSQFYCDDRLISSFTYTQLVDILTDRRNDSDGELTANPFFIIDGHICTSPVLILDSLAPWLLSEVENSESLRQIVISNVFEDKVLEAVRSAGIRANTIEDSGSWKIYSDPVYVPETNSWTYKEASIDLAKYYTKPPGEIDIVAFNGDSYMLIECKSIYTLGRINNIREKLAESYKWRSNARKKLAWLREALAAWLQCNADSIQIDACIVIEGVTQTDLIRETDTDVPLIDFSILQNALDEWSKTQYFPTIE